MTAGTAYGEDPKDKAVIRFGINYYETNYGKKSIILFISIL